MSISVASLLPNIPTSKLNSAMDARKEVQELVEEGLVGEFSTVMNIISEETIDHFDFTQWSEESNNQWWALTEEGEVGQEAAGYLEQMVEERRHYATSYMDDYFSLSNKMFEMLQDDYPVSAQLDQLLDNVAAGRMPSENTDGSTLPKAEILDVFWQENEPAIQQMLEHYENLKNVPDNLSDWLDRKQIDRSAEVDRLVEKHRYSGLNGNYAASEALTDTSYFRLQREGDGEVLAQKGEGLDIIVVGYSPHMAGNYDEEATQDLMQRTIEIALVMGDAGSMKGAVSSQMMHSDRQQLLTEYHVLYKPTEKRFYEQVGDLEPRFTLQDLLDNLKAGVDPAMMESGEPHPEAGKIQAFADSYVNNIDALIDRQTQLDEFPRTRMEWQAIESNSRRAEQYVYQHYGLEPWETGNNARALREGVWQGMEYFEHQSESMKERILSQAQRRAESLDQKLQQLLVGVSSGGLKLEQLIENFRFNRPAGTLPDGGIHPRNAELERFLESNEEDIVAYIDSAWLLGEQQNLAMVDYTRWMTHDRAENYAETLAELIRQSRAAIDIDGIITGELQDSLLEGNR